jgi:predicted O-linked N-acetylglucosamine transferase (SPINDLY family)
MNRKQRRAAARKKKTRAGVTKPAVAVFHPDIGSARSLYFSASSGGAGVAREARALIKSRLQGNPELWEQAFAVAADLATAGRIEDAIDICGEITDAGSADADALANAGALLTQMGRLDDARRSIARAIELAPDHAYAHNSLGVLYNRVNRPDLAAEAFRKSLAADPQFMSPCLNLCSSLRQLADWDEAKIFADKARELPGYSRNYSSTLRQLYSAICDFESLGKLGDVWENCTHIETDKLPAHFLDLLVYAEDSGSTRHLRDLVGRWAGHVERRAAAVPLPARAKGSSRAKIRVGMLSSDLRQHSVSRFLTPLMRGYDRERFEFFCYTPIRMSDDPIQSLYMEIADSFTFVDAMAVREIAAAIQADGVDILLELNGFTGGSRIEVAAYKPAPVQMSWFGYPFTTGIKAFDYCIMDRFIVPPDESLLVEEPIIMPGSWLCFGEFPEVEIDEGLPADRHGRITFGTLNNPYKFTPEMIALWARVMNRVPDSRFLLVRAQTRSRFLRGNLSEEFAKHGVSADRLFFFDNRQEDKNHLSYYNDIDISLDTFPLTGGTTTCEATWMGVPVITLVGESFHQRLSYTMLMNCGLEAFCAFTTEDFVDRAVKLAGDRDRLLAWRHGLRDVMRSSSLCDEERFVDDFQTMLEQVAGIHGLRSGIQAVSVTQGAPA